MAGRPGEAGKTGLAGAKGRISTIYGYIEKTNCNQVRGSGIIYLDRHNLQCDRWGDEFMERFQLMQGKCPGNEMQYEYLCVSPGTWETCATQGGVCKCNGLVRYGSEPYFTKGTRINGEIACDDKTWGDPFNGKAKKCQCASQQDMGAQDCVKDLLTPCQDFGDVVAVSSMYVAVSSMYETRVLQ